MGGSVAPCETPVIMSNPFRGYRTISQHLNDLKKENFSLKLRIYFLEERIQHKYEESSEDVHKKNIELKVEVESLKQELTEKQNILDKALSTAESLTNQNENERQRLCEERQQEISHLQEILETKIQLLQEEAQQARGEAEKMASLAEAESQRCLTLERGVETKEALEEKDRLIWELTEDRKLLSNQVADMEVTIHDLSSALQRKDIDAKRLDDQQSQLSHNESGAGQCVTELQKARYQVTSLQAKIRESDNRNQKMQERLGEMERELCLVREEAQRQERTVLNLTDTVSSQQTETEEMSRVIEEQNNMLCSLKELVTRNELQTPQVWGAESVRGQGEVLALQVSLFQAQLELQAGKRAQRQATRRGEDLRRALTRLEADMQDALEHRHSTDRHNQDLHLALEKAGCALKQKEEQLIEEEDERQRQKEDMEKTITELQTSLQSKEQLVQEYWELLEQQQGPREKREPLLARLRQRIKERDRALERAVDEKFRCLEEKEGEVRRLRLLLRDKDRDLERQRCVLSNNQETITSLELLVRGKGLEMEQVCEAWRSLQHHREESEQRHGHSLRERDTLISQLQSALHTRAKEAEHLTTVLLGKVRAGPSEVVEELKARLSLKEKLFQDLLSDHSRQGLEHHSQVQELLNTIAARDQYIKDSAGRLGEVMAEQTIRLQELRRQLNSGCQLGIQGPEISPELQTMREELRLALMREREAQAELTALRTQGCAWPAERQAEFEEFSSDEEDDDVKSEYADSMEEEDSKLTALTLTTTQKAEHGGSPGKWKPSQDAVGGGEAQVEVKQLVQQKMVVERELRELKAHLVKAGFSSLSQMRKAVHSLHMENEELTAHQTTRRHNTNSWDDLRLLEEEEDEEELHVDEEEEELCRADLWEGWDDAPIPTVRDSGMGKRHCARPMSLDLGALLSHSPQGIDEEEIGRDGGSRQSHTEAVVDEEPVGVKEAERLQLESKELQERLMVSEATVQAQAEQLKDYRDLLTETPIQQNSKQVQVDLPDMGYETCGRSENEAEREETSSPEFDDLEMCTSLECSGSKWWSGTVHPAKASPPTSTSQSADIKSLQRLVEDLRSQLSNSQTVIRNLQGRLRSLSTSSDPVGHSNGPSNSRKVNWSFQFQASPSQSSPEDDEGWESSGGGLGPSPCHPKPDKDLQQLESRVGAIEDQLRRDKGTPVGTPEAATWPGPGRFDTLIQAQARELSHLRQRMREGLGVCHILTQHLGDTTKAFEELLRANDIDYYMGQSFREQLAQSSALAQRASTKISGRDHPEIQDDKTGTELLAIRLSKELQQKDKTIEALRVKLNLNQPRSETPCSSHGLSDITDQSDRISFVSDDQGSTNGDLDMCSEMEAASSHCNSIPMSHHQSIAPSNTPSHGQQSSVSHPSMQHSGDTHSQTGIYSGPVPNSFPIFPQPHPLYHTDLSSQRAPLPFDPHMATLRPRYHGSGPGGFSLAEVHQELQMLQRKLRETERFAVPSAKPLGGFPLPSHPQTDSCYLPQPLSYLTFQPSTLSGSNSGLNIGLNASPAMKAGVSLPEISALWDMGYAAQPMTVADLSSGSSGYQSGTSHIGSDLMKEHLREIRSLRQRLEDSIHANERLRQQLEERLALQNRENAGPTNIYIQGLDSVSQLSSELKVLKEENLRLQARLQQASRDSFKETEQLQEAVLLGRGQVKEAELETEKWAEQGRRLQTQAQTQTLEISQLKQDRQSHQEAMNRLQHEVSVLQQQLCESRGLIHSLESELQMYQSVCGILKNTHADQVSHSFDTGNAHVHLEQQVTTGTRPAGAKKQLFYDQTLSPPDGDPGVLSTAVLSSTLNHQKVDVSLEGLATDGSFANHNGRHAVGHVDDFRALQQQILEGRVHIGKIQTAIEVMANCSLLELSQDKDVNASGLRALLTSIKTLQQILEEASSLLRTFWKAAHPGPEASQKEQSLKDEVHSLRQRISEQEEALRVAVESLRSSNHTKDSMEHFIIRQLSSTKDVLKKARTNLEENDERMSSLGITSSPPLSFSSSSYPWLVKVKTSEASGSPSSLLFGVS